MIHFGSPHFWPTVQPSDCTVLQLFGKCDGTMTNPSHFGNWKHSVLIYWTDSFSKSHYWCNFLSFLVKTDNDFSKIHIEENLNNLQMASVKSLKLQQTSMSPIFLCFKSNPPWLDKDTHDGTPSQCRLIQWPWERESPRGPLPADFGLLTCCPSNQNKARVQWFITVMEL